MMTQNTRGLPSGIDAVMWWLRIGAFMCFVGHGAFGIITKAGWVPYFGVVGLGSAAAYRLMPWVGAVDIVMGFLILLTPRPFIAYWMIGWAIWTASLRPLSGEPVWETLERAGNYGAPLGLLLLMTPVNSIRGLFECATFRLMTPERVQMLRRVLTMVVVLLMFGHGALGVIGKAGLIYNYTAVLSASGAAEVTPAIGWAEIAFAILVLVWQNPVLLIGVAAWKIATEWLFVAAGAPIWEFIERGGSYATPFALAMIVVLQRGLSVTGTSREMEVPPRVR